MVDGCIFCKIVRGEIPCYKIYENEKFLVFLDAFPAVRGQTLIIPKNHLGGYLFDVDSEDYKELMLLAKKIAKVLDASLGPKRTFMLVEGLQVDHVHIKLFPAYEGENVDYRSVNEKSPEEMAEIAEKIASKL